MYAEGAYTFHSTSVDPSTSEEMICSGFSLGLHVFEPICEEADNPLPSFYRVWN